jgi:hypothetical protein
MKCKKSGFLTFINRSGPFSLRLIPKFKQMRAFLFFVLIITSTAIYAQKPCYQHSRLYLFDKHNEPRLFTDPLGRRPQFPFLQRMNGITTAELFIKSIRDTLQQQKYARTFKAFDLLLRNSGFWHGYKDLNTKNVRKVYITPGTIGNLGFYNKETDVMNYLYVKLNPSGESPEGVEAWKLITKDGCFLYILFTCGNAFYPNGDAVVINGGGEPGGICCRTITVKSTATAVPQQKDSITRPVDLRMNYYLAHLTPSHKRGRTYDTTVELIRYKDTLIHFKDRLVIPAKLDSASSIKYFNVCRDSIVQMRFPLVGDSTKETDSVHILKYVLADTVYDRTKPPKEETECDNHWAVSVEIGKSWNSIPRLNDPVQHTQTNGSMITGDIEISRILVRWFQLGIRASYIVLAYQDDVNYPGYTPGTYNTVYLAKPIIPIQLFGKFNWGKEIGWQSSMSIAFGFSIPTNGKIENGTTVLSTNPNLKGDFTASLKFGVAYYFSCHVGVGFNFTGEYFNNKSDLIAYSLYALPIQGGLHFRF